MKKRFLIIALALLFISAIYFAGPRPAPLLLSQDWPEIELSLAELETAIEQKESKYLLRQDNEARIIWADSSRKTEWVILYIHGFSASQGEGAPVHQNIADKMGANLLLARLSGHGYQVDQLSDYSASSGWEDAKYYLALAQKLGDKVMVMGTSTGCSYALNLAAEFPDKVDALVNLSANIRVNDPAAFLLNDPWGLEIAEMVLGSHRRIVSDSIGHAHYWDTLYTVNAVVELEHLLESTLVESTFARISQPTLNLCYYKSEQEQDPVVRVDKIEWMHENLGTSPELKRLVKLQNVGNHVLASPIKSNDIVETQSAIESFLQEVIGIEF